MVQSRKQHESGLGLENEGQVFRVSLSENEHQADETSSSNYSAAHRATSLPLQSISKQPLEAINASADIPVMRSASETSRPGDSKARSIKLAPIRRLSSQSPTLPVLSTQHQPTEPLSPLSLQRESSGRTSPSGQHSALLTKLARIRSASSQSSPHVSPTLSPQLSAHNSSSVPGLYALDPSGGQSSVSTASVRGIQGVRRLCKSPTSREEGGVGEAEDPVGLLKGESIKEKLTRRMSQRIKASVEELKEHKVEEDSQQPSDPHAALLKVKCKIAALTRLTVPKGDASASEPLSPSAPQPPSKISLWTRIVH